MPAKGQTPPAHVGMFQLLNGVYITGAISCLARLGVPDLVERGRHDKDLGHRHGRTAAEFGPRSRRHRYSRRTAALISIDQSGTMKYWRAALK